MKKISTLAFGLCVVLISGVSYANHPDGVDKVDNTQSYDMSDADFGISHFDTDQDGLISLKEYLSGDAANTEKLYQHLDANGDGKLDMQEQQEIEAVYKAIHDQYQAKRTSI